VDTAQIADIGGADAGYIDAVKSIMPGTKRCIAVGPLLSITILVLPACSSSGFECGTPLESDPEQTYTCARPEEVCICSTPTDLYLSHDTWDAAPAG